MNDKEKIEIYERMIDSNKLFTSALQRQIKQLEEDIIKLRKAKDRDALIEPGSGEFKGTEFGDKTDGESLYFHPSYHHENNIGKIDRQSIIIAPTKGVVNFQAYQQYDIKPFRMDSTIFWFTREEVMILIQALAEAIAMIERGEE